MVRRTTIGVGILCMVWVGFAGAQNSTGALSGSIRDTEGGLLVGATVDVASGELGIRRQAVTNSSGAYRVAGLPPGLYEVTVSIQGFDPARARVRVELGVTTAFSPSLVLAAFAGDVEVEASEMTLDDRSSTSGANLRVDLLDAALPLNHDTTQIAGLVPGTVPGNQRFSPVSQICQTGLCGDLSVGWGTPGQDLFAFNGASIAENLYVVDGLNITNFSQGLGSSFVPMSFIEEVQVKTGGVDAEFGHSTGGVVNMITKRGGNTVRGQASVLFAPRSLQESSPSTILQDFAQEESESTELTASVGGPLVRDRLFFFLFARYLDAENTAFPGYAQFAFSESNPYWGGKVDWTMAEGHRLEGTLISDSVGVDLTRVVYDEDNAFSRSYPATEHRGGENVILRYTGVLTDALLLSAQFGRNPFDRYQTSPTDDCPYALMDFAADQTPVGCWANRIIGTWRDTRWVARADADWFVGNHSFRGGFDFERAESDVDYRYSGDGHYYYYDRALYWGFPLPPLTEIVAVGYFRVQGTVGMDTSAAYAQDSWAITPNFTLNLGLRWERTDAFNTDDQTFLDVKDEVVPRVGFVWDPSGDGRSKVFGSLGRYVIPYSTELAGFWGTAETSWYEVYVLDGEINPDGTPSGLGEFVTDWHGGDGTVRDPQRVGADNLESTSQWEAVLGYEAAVGENWTWGIRGVAREMDSVLEDVSLDRGLWNAYGIEEPGIVYSNSRFRVVNPGQDFHGWFDLDGDGVLDPIVLTADQMGYPEAERKYQAIELVARRRFTGNWMLEASYTWSHSYGNYEGRVRSDLGQANAGYTIDFEYPAFTDYAWGNLPNDRRHFGRIFGSYRWDSGFGVGAVLFAHSGQPISSRGYHPTDTATWYADSTHYRSPLSFFTLGEPSPRGTAGRTDSVWWLDLTLRYDWNWGDVDLYLRADAFNVFDNDAVTNVYEGGDYIPGTADSDWGSPTNYQTPRKVRFGMGVSF